MRGSAQSHRLTVWDNFERQKAALEKDGATPAQIARLRRAAQAVVDAEAAAQTALASIDEVTSPRTCANGWIIQPPTKSARYYATVVGTTAVGGVTPETRVGELMLIVAGLWALWKCGDGHGVEVVRVLATKGGVESLVSELMSSTGLMLADKLAEDYATLMGFTMPPSQGADQAVVRYQQVHREIQQRLRGSSPRPRRGNRS